MGRDTFFLLKKGQSAEDVALALYSVLKKTSAFRDYLTRLLKSLCGRITSVTSGISPYVIDHSTHIIRPRDVPIPTHRLGYVYLLVSTRQLNFVYIGSTFDLIQRRDKHNKGFGAMQTSPSWLRPWAILAYIVGFNACKPKFVMVENQWIRRKDEMLRDQRTNATVTRIIEEGKSLVASHNATVPGDNLQFVDCGTVQRFGDNDNVP